MSDNLIIALIGAVAVVLSGALSALIAYFGFKLTLETSTTANARIAEISRQNMLQQLRSSASGKIAEMRQLWNDDLRSHLARFGADTSRLISSYVHDNDQPTDDVQYLYSYIILKLNKNEPSHDALVTTMERMLSIINHFIVYPEIAESVRKDKNKEFTALSAVFYKMSGEVLKAEWNKAKKEIRSEVM